MDPRDSRAARRLAAAAAAIEATNSAARLASDPLAAELATFAAGLRQRLEARLESAPPDGLTLPMFPDHA